LVELDFFAGLRMFLAVSSVLCGFPEDQDECLTPFYLSPTQNILPFQKCRTEVQAQGSVAAALATSWLYTMHGGI
jgi:hypothetical protein